MFKIALIYEGKYAASQRDLAAVRREACSCQKEYLMQYEGVTVTQGGIPLATQ